MKEKHIFVQLGEWCTVTWPTKLRDFKNAPFYILCLFHMIDLKMFFNHFLSSCKMDRDLPWFRFAHAVHSDVISTQVFFKNCLLTNVNLIQFENKHFKLVARCLNKWKNTDIFRKIVLLHPTRSVSLPTSVLNFQTSITDGWRPRLSRYFCLLCNCLRSICWQHFFLLLFLILVI